MACVVIMKATLKHRAKQRNYLAAWQSGNRIIQAQAGARGASLLTDPLNPRTFYTILRWDSRAARDAAIEALGLNGPDRDAVNQRIHPHRQFADIEIVGVFDETNSIP